MRNFLALDLGSKTGFCVFSENKEETRCLESGTKNFNTQKKSSLGRRFVCFRDWLRTLIHKYEIKGVYYEQVYGIPEFKLRVFTVDFYITWQRSAMISTSRCAI